VRMGAPVLTREGFVEETEERVGIPGMLCTLAIVKPDAFARGLQFKVREIAINDGFSLHHGWVGRPPADAMREFYGAQHEGKPYFDKLVDHMTSGLCHFVVLAHPEEAIGRWRKLMGAAKDPAVGTIRSHFCEGLPIMENLVHGSDSPESFWHEFEVLRRHGLLTL